MTDRHQLKLLVAVTALLSFAFFRHGIEPAEAGRISDIRGTRHNLSAVADGTATPSGGTVPVRTMKATTETEICVFCHTPHQAANNVTPLWNRKTEGAGVGATYTQNYIVYSSNTLDATQVQGTLNQPGGSSKLCLSCHDGLIAIGNVSVYNGLKTPGSYAASNPTSAPGTATIATTLPGGANTMPVGPGADTGFTRNLGVDLSNDHPISVSYNATLAGLDGELYSPAASGDTRVGLRSPGVKPKLPLEKTGPAGANLAQVQCATCHDPHIRETDTTKGNQKFLRLNRFQERMPATAAAAAFNDTINSGDIICLACHDKNQGTGAWAFSAHAHSDVADETYTAAAATQREFPDGTGGTALLPVWRAACLNCHDTHTVKGARRLLREGTDSTATPKSGGSPALEEVCYQCHQATATSIITTVTVGAPNIKTDFTTLNRRMPITNGAQGTPSAHPAVEPHNPSSYTGVDNTATGTGDINLNCQTAGTRCGKDLIEARSLLGAGAGNDVNRHVECTDCHNPHRLIRTNDGLPGLLAQGNTKDGLPAGRNTGAGTHRHTDTTGYVHSNRISGVLRGSWGVEPVYGGVAFLSRPTSYAVKRGDPGNNTSAAAGETYVTREYQICLKCHSDYGYSDDGVYPSGTSRPLLGGINLTPTTSVTPRTNYTRYTNQAMEFQAPSTHQGKPASTTDSGAGSGYSTNNYRGWHPVMAPTGRTGSLRGNGTDISSNWRAPWSNAGAVGAQTMYCTDCHGSATADTTVIPAASSPWGPHGSANDFLLKGTYTAATGSTADGTAGLCFRCHNPGIYRGDIQNQRTGFWIGRGNRGTGKDGHATHYSKLGNTPLKCNWCHIAVPHGWKNKSLLVNMNDVGLEAGKAPAGSVTIPYSEGPYYRNSMLRVNVFGPSGNWAIGDCGNPGNTDDQARAWMQGSCNTPP